MNGSLMEDKITIDMIHDFKPEKGIASDTFNRILEAGKIKDFEKMLEKLYPQGITTEELNDLLSEDYQKIYDELGMEKFLKSEEEL